MRIKYFWSVSPKRANKPRQRNDQRKVMNHRIDLALKDFTPFRASTYLMRPRTGAMNAGRVRGRDRRLR